MGSIRRSLKLLLSLLAILGVLICAVSAAESEKRLTILFTHDTHDHFLPMPAEGGGEYGGYTRLATLLEVARATAQTPVVTLDGGDFSMGSLFQTIYATDAPELRALGAMGYDVSTLGNHEFDYRAQGFADMLRAAIESGEDLPALVQANYKLPATDEDTRSAWEEYGITDYVILQRDGLCVAVFGVLGVDANECAPMSGMEFEPIADAAKRVVAELEEAEHPDFVICLSHSGTDGKGKGEDYQLAKAVPGIDVIVSGHTHSTTQEPIQVGDTVIVSCGAYTQNLGQLTVAKDANGTITVEDYKLIPVDESVPTHSAMATMATKLTQKVGEGYLSHYGLTFDQVLATSPFDFTPITQFGTVQEEAPLGSLIADAYIYAVQEAEGADYVDVDFAVVAEGVIRGSFAQGDITVSDAFNVSSLGSGGDGTPGYPLISVYLTGRELRDAFEVDASVAPLMSAAQLYGSGMTWSFNPHRMIFNKVTDYAQVLSDGTTLPLEDERLYRVVTGLYSGQMLGAVNGKSFGLLTITPKDEQGNPVADFESRIIHNQGGTEVKEWVALASYLQSMCQIDGRYAAPEGRKLVRPSWNPIELLRAPKWMTLLVLALLVVLILVVVLVVRRPRVRRPGSGYRHYQGKGRR